MLGAAVRDGNGDVAVSATSDQPRVAFDIDNGSPSTVTSARPSTPGCRFGNSALPCSSVESSRLALPVVTFSIGKHVTKYDVYDVSRKLNGNSIGSLLLR